MRDTDLTASDFKTFIQITEKMVNDTFGDLGKWIHPTWILELESGKTEFHATPFDDETHKQLTTITMKMYFKAKGVIRYAFVMEAWFASEERKDSETEKEWMERGVETPPSQRPDRKEAVCIIAEDKNTGESVFIMHEIDRSGDQPRLLPDQAKDMTGIGGRFTNMFEINKTKH
jgi:hypothetical protein